MSDVDYYDVQAMIRDARSEIRGEIDNAIREACKNMREEINGVANDLAREIEGVERTLQSRTAHLV